MGATYIPANIHYIFVSSFNIILVFPCFPNVSNILIDYYHDDSKAK